MADKMESFLAARATINTEVARAAWNDDAFRRSLVADPKAVIAKRLGQPLPAGITVTVHEESPTHFHLVIPTKPDQNTELSDEELEQVAGGASPAALTILPAFGILTAFAAPGIAMSVNNAARGGSGKFW